MREVHRPRLAAWPPNPGSKPRRSPRCNGWPGLRTSTGKPALFLGDERVEFIEFQRLDTWLPLTFLGQRRSGEVGGGGVDPAGDTLRVDAQVSCDAPEVGAVHIEFEGLATHRKVVAFGFWGGRVGAPAVTTLAAQGAGRVLAGAVLFGRCPASGATTAKAQALIEGLDIEGLDQAWLIIGRKYLPTQVRHSLPVSCRALRGPLWGRGSGGFSGT